MPNFPIISNGNVITYDDVVSNKMVTGADGIMSAEGILDNPALYLPRLEILTEMGNVKYPFQLFHLTLCMEVMVLMRRKRKKSGSFIRN